MAGKRIDDLEILIATAVGQLTQSLRDGDEKHEPGSWMLESVDNQLKHLEEHLAAIRNDEWVDERGHSHVAHVICRGVMLVAIRRRLGLE